MRKPFILPGTGLLWTGLDTLPVTNSIKALRDMQLILHNLQLRNKNTKYIKQTQCNDSNTDI